MRKKQLQRLGEFLRVLRQVLGANLQRPRLLLRGFQLRLIGFRRSLGHPRFGVHAVELGQQPAGVRSDLAQNYPDIPLRIQARGLRLLCGRRLRLHAQRRGASQQNPYSRGAMHVSFNLA